MARKKSDRDPFEVELSPERMKEVTDFLRREFDFAEQARSAIVGDNGRIDLAHARYEQGKRLTKNTPWPGAADLGSWIVTECVDALRARVVSTIFTDPIWTVEGFGASADKAPFVEAFHQWKAEEAHLQQQMSRAVHNALVEGMGVIEVTDRIVYRKGPRKIRALIQQDQATMLPVMAGDGNPQLVKLANGKYQEAQEGEPYVEMIVSDACRSTAGPQYRVHSLKNFFILPGHASEFADVWGYAKRFWRRLPELRRREEDGYYKNVDLLTGTSDRQPTPVLQSQGQDIVPQSDETAEKEIIEMTFLADLDDDGFEEWYVATFSRQHGVMLRLQFENYDTPKYALLVPYPRPNSIYGYSFADDKLGSLYDEHEALRNMFADRMALATSAPLQVLTTSAWDSARRPFGPSRTISVRDHGEIKQMDIKDVPPSVIQAIQMVIATKERIAGMNDTTVGVQSQQDRTLGEVKLVTEQSWIRIDEIIKNFQEGLENLFDINQTIWVEKLSQQPEDIPGDLLKLMQERNIDIDAAQITDESLRGIFRGKPRGSVEGSDLTKMRADVAQFLTAINQLAMTVPALQAHLNQPNVIRAILSEVVRIYRFPNREAMVGNFTGQMPVGPTVPGGVEGLQQPQPQPVGVPGVPAAQSPPPGGFKPPQFQLGQGGKR